MAGIKISEATLREQLKGTENLPIVDTDLDAGRTSIDNIKEYVQQDLSEYVKTSDLDEFTIAEIESDTGKSIIRNEETGSGPMYHHVDGTYSYVGVHNGGADDIGVLTYVKNNDTSVGTRINVYVKGAYYIPNKANTDADYVADNPDREIAVKGDIPNIENLATLESLNELSEKVDSLSSAVTPTKVSDLENDSEFVTSSELSEAKTTLEERIAVLVDRVDALEERIAQFTARITALEEQSTVLYNN